MLEKNENEFCRLRPHNTELYLIEERAEKSKGVIEKRRVNNCDNFFRMSDENVTMNTLNFFFKKKNNYDLMMKLTKNIEEIRISEETILNRSCQGI